MINMLLALVIQIALVTWINDNQQLFVFTLSGAPVSWKSTKHIDVRYQFVQEIISEGRILLQKIDAIENPIDLLTKVVTAIKFNNCLDLTNIAKL